MPRPRTCPAVVAGLTQSAVDGVPHRDPLGRLSRRDPIAEPVCKVLRVNGVRARSPERLTVVELGRRRRWSEEEKRRLTLIHGVEDAAIVLILSAPVSVVRVPPEMRREGISGFGHPIPSRAIFTSSADVEGSPLAARASRTCSAPCSPSAVGR